MNDAPPPSSVVIVGASAAGATVATGLRDEGFAGRIVLVGDEAWPPYDRPPLSKRRLAAPGAPMAQLGLHTADALAGRGIELMTGLRAVAMDLARRRLRLSNGHELAWDRCVIATGAAPLTLPGAMTLRTVDHAAQFGQMLDRGGHLMVVGAGVLGCEVAALARAAGCEVSIVGPQPAPMQDRLGPVVSARLARLHLDHGVRFHLNRGVLQLTQRRPWGVRVTLDDGHELDATGVVAAIGCKPAVNWLANSGVPLEDGVKCDEFCEASPGVYAAGDCANWFNPRFGRRMRTEHRMNATEQGLAVAANIAGHRQPFAPLPFFWTDQFDVKIQVAGIISAEHQVEFIEGSVDDESFVVTYRKDGKVEGVLTWNRPRALRYARDLIGRAD